MKFPFRTFAIFMMTSLCSFNAFSSPLNVDALVQTEMKDLMQKEHIPGAAVLLYHQGQMHSYTFGVTDLKTRNPVNLDTIFELGSVTKTFITLLLAEEVQSGKVKLSDKLSLGSTSLNQISLLELATHTSSLPFNATGVPYNAENEKGALTQYLQTWTPPYPPGTVWSYSNLGFGLLGMDLAEINHQSLDQLLKEKILTPLQMTHSGLQTFALPDKATGYRKDGKVAVSNDEPGLLGAAWAMKSSPKDMENYLRAALELPGTPENIDSAMKLTQMAYLQNPENLMKFSLAWVITPLSNLTSRDLNQVQTSHNFNPQKIQFLKPPTLISDGLISKTGATDGFRSYIGLLPDSEEGIVILINRYTPDVSPLQQTGEKILLKTAGITVKKGSENRGNGKEPLFF